jgi:hypothetical protein
VERGKRNRPHPFRARGRRRVVSARPRLFACQGTAVLPTSDSLRFRTGFGLVLQRLLRSLLIGLLIRRCIPAGPHPPRQAGGVEYVSPSTTAAATPSAKSPSPFETHPEASLRSGIRRSGHSSPRTGSGSATGPCSHSHGSCSIPSWHCRTLLSGGSLVIVLSWRFHTSGTSSARRALRVHAVRDARISDTRRCRQSLPQGDRPCDPAPVQLDLAPVRRPAPWALFRLLLAWSRPPFRKILLLFPDPLRHPVPFRRVVFHSSGIHPFRYCAFPGGGLDRDRSNRP